MIGTPESAAGNKHLPPLRERYSMRSLFSPSSIRTQLSLTVFVGLVCTASSLSAQCRTADAQTTNMLRYMRSLATATVPADSESVGIRTTYKIPAVAATQVSLVTTARTCNSALAAFNTAAPQLTPKPTSVYVIAVGSVYVVWASRAASSEWTQHIVFNSKFQVLSEFAG
jgi:hypothetical protein